MDNIYLKLDGIKGPSTSAQAKEEIEVLSMTHGVSMPLTAGAGSGSSVKHGRCVHQDITITKHLDVTSPTLNLKVSGGDNIKTAVVSFFQADKSDGDPVLYYKIELEDVIITSASVSGGGGLPVETITLHYNKIKWTYATQEKSAPGGKKGNVATGWDLEANKKV